MRKKRRNLLFATVFFSVIPIGQVFSSEGGDDTNSVQTGRFTYAKSTTDILGEEGAESYSQVFPVDEVQEWEIVVPSDYDPEKPPGVLVYISPSNSGRIPRKWVDSIQSENLIWIAASRSGNDTAVARRIAYALLAIGIIDDQYKVDPMRIYLAGFSGGAKVAGLVAVLYPELFSGAVYIGGAELWDDKDAAVDVSVMRRNRYVFMAGSSDFNRPLSRRIFSKYEALGIQNVDFVLMSGKGHQLPDNRQFRNALQFLGESGPPE